MENKFVFYDKISKNGKTYIKTINLRALCHQDVQAYKNKLYYIIRNKIRINSALFLFLKYVVYFFSFSTLPFHSLPFSSFPFHSLPFSSFPFHSHSLSFIYPPLFSFPTLHYSLSLSLSLFV